MPSSLAIGVAHLKARTKRIRETPHGATIVCATRDEADIMRDAAEDLGRWDITYKIQSQVDWEAKAQERADTAAAQSIADATFRDGGLVEPGHPLKEIEGTW